jgi:predicted NAD-dependent protein-ADP-ribosyltransferase YbiA (DUF1768 family)
MPKNDNWPGTEVKPQVGEDLLVETLEACLLHEKPVDYVWGFGTVRVPWKGVPE